MKTHLKIEDKPLCKNYSGNYLYLSEDLREVDCKTCLALYRFNNGFEDKYTANQYGERDEERRV